MLELNSKEVAMKVREILSDKNKWTKSTLKDLSGRMCLLGAYAKVLKPRGSNTYQFLGDSKPIIDFATFLRGGLKPHEDDVASTVYRFNDAPKTTHADVLAKLDAFIKKTS